MAYTKSLLRIIDELNTIVSPEGFVWLDEVLSTIVKLDPIAPLAVALNDPAVWGREWRRQLADSRKGNGQAQQRHGWSVSEMLRRAEALTAAEGASVTSDRHLVQAMAEQAAGLQMLGVNVETLITSTTARDLVDNPRSRPTAETPAGGDGTAKDAPEYDVALSFAGEDRPYAEELAAALQAVNVAVFYDEFAVADMWGQDLVEYLSKIYQKKASHVVMFISEHYAHKSFPRHERRSALSRAIHEADPYVLPIRLDDTEIDGLLPTVAYIEWHSYTPEGIAKMVLTKLGRMSDKDTSNREESTRLRVPTTDAGLAHVAKTRPRYWEYTLFAGSLMAARNALEPKWLDHQMAFGQPSGRSLDDGESLQYLRGAFDTPLRVLANFNKLFDPKTTEAAFGAPGQPGDASRINHLAKGILRCHEELLDWAATTRSVKVSARFQRSLSLVSQFANQPIQQLHDFIEGVFTSVSQIPELVADAEHRPAVLELTCVLSVDDTIASALDAEIGRLK